MLVSMVRVVDQSKGSDDIQSRRSESLTNQRFCVGENDTEKKGGSLALDGRKETVPCHDRRGRRCCKQEPSGNQLAVKSVNTRLL